MPFQKLNFDKMKKSLVNKKISLSLPSRRVGRVVECGGLENHCTARYRGFESLTLRKKETKHFMLGFFVGFNSSLLEVGDNEKTKIISFRNNWFLCFDGKPEWDQRS